jgi:hypothetical protein
VHLNQKEVRVTIAALNRYAIELQEEQSTSIPGDDPFLEERVVAVESALEEMRSQLTQRGMKLWPDPRDVAELDRDTEEREKDMARRLRSYRALEEE